MDFLTLCGIAAAVLSTIAFLPYIINVVQRRTSPQRASWLIWSVLATISFFSQISEGASSSLWFAGVQTAASVTIFLLSLTLGAGRILNRSDLYVLGAASVGLGLWYVTESAIYALAISITISLLGGVLTVCQAYYQPHSETASTWAICFVASLCAIASVGSIDPVLMAYPAYVALLNVAIMLAIMLGRARAPVLAKARIPLETAPN